MANQLKMADIQAILTLHDRGWSDRRIARELGIHRETVARHVRAAEDAKPASAPTGSGDESSGPESVPNALVGGLVDEVFSSKPASAPTGFSTGSTGVSDGVSSDISGAPLGCDEAIDADVQSNGSSAWPWRVVIIEKLGQGLHAQRIFQDLCLPEHGYGGSYYSVRRLIRKLTAVHDPPMRRMECAAGEEAQVDFGTGAWIVVGSSRVDLQACKLEYSIVSPK